MDPDTAGRGFPSKSFHWRIMTVGLLISDWFDKSTALRYVYWSLIFNQKPTYIQGGGMTYFNSHIEIVHVW